MKKLLALLAIVFLTSCYGEGIEKQRTNNPEYEATFLFEKDGVRVYRFFDGSHAHYFTSAGETMSTDFSGETPREENIPAPKPPKKKSAAQF